MKGYTLFTASDAKNITEEAKKGNFISKGKVLDIIRSSAKKGNNSVTISGLNEEMRSSLVNDHKFAVENNKISW